MSLPEPRDPSRPYRICVVCLGNICRSPIAAKVLAVDLERAGLAGAVEVDSAGMGSWHLGAGMDRRAASTLRARGYFTDHVARRFDAAWFAERDLVLAMDLDNVADLREVAPEGVEIGPRLRLFRSFAPDAGSDAEVPDPYYGGDDGFSTVLNMVEAASKGLTTQLATRFGTD